MVSADLVLRSASRKMSGRGRGIKKSAGGRPKSNPSWGFFIFKQTNPDPDDEAENGTDGLLDLDSVDYSNLKPGEVLGHCKVPGCKTTVDVSSAK